MRWRKMARGFLKIHWHPCAILSARLLSTCWWRSHNSNCLLGAARINDNFDLENEMGVLSPGTPSRLIWKPLWKICRSSKASFTVLIGPVGTMAFSNAYNKEFLLQLSIVVPSMAVKAARWLTRSGFVANLGSVPKCPRLTISQSAQNCQSFLKAIIISPSLVLNIWYKTILMGIPKLLGRITYGQKVHRLVG